MSILFEIKSRRKRPTKILYLFMLYLQKSLKVDFKINGNGLGKKIDVVIPTVSKDFGLLGQVVASLSNVNHYINKIFIIAPALDNIIGFCANNGLCFVDENSVLGYSKDVIEYTVNDIDRSGWIFQQLLKLGANKFVECDDYLVIDSDTVLVNSHSFIDNGKYVFFESAEWHEAYFDTYYKLFGYKPQNNLSFISHMMIFNKGFLAQMKAEIEKKNGKVWDKAIMSFMDKKEKSYFSEYETYGNYMLKHHPESIVCKPFYNTSLKANAPRSSSLLSKNFSKKYNSVSFHNWTQ